MVGEPAAGIGPAPGNAALDTANTDIEAEFRSAPLSNLADAPPVSGRFWADLEDASSEAGGPDPPDCGPGSPQEDEDEARERVMLQWVLVPSRNVLHVSGSFSRTSPRRAT